MSAFNGDKQVQARVKQIQTQFSCPIGIETGTLRGWTTAALSDIFPKVFTIENDLTSYAVSKILLSEKKNVQLFLGNSGEVLVSLLQELKPTLTDNQHIFFYLDAHWNEFWPLLDELHSIDKHIGPKSVIMIDDIQVPGRPDIPFDSYNGLACSYEYVKPVLDKIYDDTYTIEYLFPSDDSVQRCHAKLLICPVYS